VQGAAAAQATASCAWKAGAWKAGALARTHDLYDLVREVPGPDVDQRVDQRRRVLHHGQRLEHQRLDEEGCAAEDVEVEVARRVKGIRLALQRHAVVEQPQHVEHKGEAKLEGEEVGHQAPDLRVQVWQRA
jgi:hypothetical protein